MVRKLQKKLLAGILALLISTMSVGTLPVGAIEPVVGVTLGSATFSGGQYHYENAVVSGDGIQTILLSFAKNVTAGDKITLPSTTGFTVSTTSNDYTKRINVSSNKTAGDVQAYLRGVGITLASESQTLSVTVTTENITTDTFYNIDTEHYYQYIVNSSIDWITAYNTAKRMTYMGRTGYLATITSLDEDTYVNALSGGKTGWLGGTILKNNGSMVDASGGTSGARLYYSQTYTNTNGVVSSGWYWACGPEIGTTFYNVNTLYPGANSSNAATLDANNTATYFNWARGQQSYEPNNETATAPSSSLDYYETCLTTLLVTSNTGKHGTAFSWNDKYYTGAGSGQWATRGYFVEYGNLPRSDNGVGSAAFASDSGDLTRANTITATVTVQKDGSLWSGSGKSLALYQDGTKKYDLVLSGSTAACSALAGTYDVYDGTADTGVDISVSSGGGNATVDYYTLNLVAGAGTSLTTGSGVYLPGKNVPIDATVTTGYEWSKWTSGNTTLLSDQPTKSTNIRMPAGQITLTATAAPSTNEVYTIDYDTETIRYNSVYEITADTTVFPLAIIESGSSIASYISDYNTETTAQSIYVRVKAADDAPAGEWTEITISARPETPAATATAETMAGKNDGRISGVTTAMEWKADGGTYAPVTADQISNGITGLSDGTYYVRYKAGGSAFKSAEQEITIAAGHTIAVTFNSQSGSDVAGMTGKAYGDSVTAPAAPTRSGFYFAGWYKDAACTNAWTFTLDTLTDNITLFAKWSTIPTYTVTGRIVDETAQAVEGATVRIMQGTTQFGTTGVTNPNGDFVIDNVPPGTYNLVITKGTKTAVIKVEVSDGNVAIGNATLPSGNANSVLVVNGSDTPNVVVGGLDSEAAVQLADSVDPHTDNVKITLTVAATDASTAVNGSEVADAVTSAGKQIGMVLAIDVSKTVNGNEDASYNETNGLIEIIIPLPAGLQGKASYAVYRYHNGVIDTITETPNDGEYIAVNADNITLHVKKFSTYAIGYTDPVSSSGGGGSVSTSYTITASAGEGGSISPTAASVAKGGSKTFTITADEGYEIADVKVDGTSVGTVNSYTFSDIGADHTIAAAFTRKETAALPYYVENGKEIFIGFASDASGTMKYIAPEGATVLFQENPKSFSDIAGHWAKDNIDFVTERELFFGTGGGKFSPESGMTRAMFATVIGRLYERSYGEILQKDNHAFTDVDYSAYYGAYIDWAAANNIITGVGGGLFQPDREITREEMAAILYRFAEFLKVSPSGPEKTQLNYPDAAHISSWAIEAAVYCQQTGIITGRSGGNFVPQGTATRAEVAAILQKFIESSVK